jgi:hypothetical protein
MRKATIHGLLAAAAVSLPLMMASPVHAASVLVCRAYGNEAVEAAKKVRELKCGFDMNHPQWSLEAKDHRQWCQASSNESVDHENVERRDQVFRCSECRTYAMLAAFAARQNKEMKCGFSGPAWHEDSEVHFGWCMGLTRPTSSYYFGALTLTGPLPTGDEEAARSQALEECRGRQAKKSCTGCHGGAPQVSGAPAVLRKLSTGTGVDKAGTSSPRSVPAAIKSGTSRRDAASSRVDRVKSPSSGSSAMDRLGGSASPAPGVGGSSDGGRAGAKPSAGPSGTMPGGSASGGGAGASTFRSPSNMVAPPPAGGPR